MIAPGYDATRTVNVLAPGAVFARPSGRSRVITIGAGVIPMRRAAGAGIKQDDGSTVRARSVALATPGVVDRKGE